MTHSIWQADEQAGRHGRQTGVKSGGNQAESADIPAARNFGAQSTEIAEKAAVSATFPLAEIPAKVWWLAFEFVTKILAPSEVPNPHVARASVRIQSSWLGQSKFWLC
jgi:hypothetical protein